MLDLCISSRGAATRLAGSPCGVGLIQCEWQQVVAWSSGAAACLQGRLLHYFPPEAGRQQPWQQTIPTNGDIQHTLTSTDGPHVSSRPSADDSPADSWCGEHTDHGALTGLTAAMYLQGGNEVPCPGSQAGLYIRTCHRQPLRVSIPPDHLAFQMGETFQVACPLHG